jgi:hypothetical protein
MLSPWFNNGIQFSAAVYQKREILVSYKLNSKQNGKNFCRKNAQKTQNNGNLFCAFCPRPAI